MLGDLVREALVDNLLQAAQASRADHDHRRVEFVGDVDDPLPRATRDFPTRLGDEPGGTCDLRASTCHLSSFGGVQFFEGGAGHDR